MFLLHFIKRLTEGVEIGRTKPIYLGKRSVAFYLFEQGLLGYRKLAVSASELLDALDVRRYLVCQIGRAHV